MSNDQASAVDGEADFLNALGPEPEEKEETEEPEGTEDEPEGEPEIPEAEEAAPELFKITIKNSDGEDEEKEVSLDDLAKGYMLEADYTRKTQAVAEEKRAVETKFAKDLATVQQSAVDRINQLQELVIKQAAPELGSVDWVTLAASDPAEFVRLKAKEDQLQRTLNGLDAERKQAQQAHEQTLNQQTEQALKHSDELLTKAIPDFNADKATKLFKDVEKSLGLKPQDITYAARVIAQAGMPSDFLGKVLLAAHKAAQLDELSAKKPAALKKVAAAPKVIRPSAPQPKKHNQAALDRLKKNGRGEDFMSFL